MTPEQFCMWLHGYLEISNPREIGETETQIIKDHLNLLYDKKTPDRNKEETPDFKKIYEEKIKVVPDLKMPPGEIKIVPQQHGLLCTCPICEAGRQMIRRDPLIRKCTCAPGTFCGCNLTVTC